ncbi:MAG: hypothetical protein GY711_30305 [bacterium]|nr:hypothetical protein [bacterium]
MVSVSFGAMSVMLMTLAALAVPVLLVWVVVKVLQGVGFVLRTLFKLVTGGGSRVARFARGEIVDTLHFAGGMLTGGVILPLAIANLAIGRWSAAAHYGRALEDELTSAGLCLYRCAIGHPIRLVGLTALTEGLERRIPDLVSRAPRSKPAPGKPKNRVFEGYKVVGTLTAGGSGARLFLARPREAKVREFLARGQSDPGQVVIKSFALADGSTLPQIVRESRALEAARRMGLVLEHELDDKSFHYVMPYVPGEDLDAVIRRVHARTAGAGLDARGVSRVVGYASDLMETLERFHRGGLWHKDIKPSNLIVSGDRIHVVDLGLVTPLESPLTLTTHGTEYFRDPELVRLALKGVKVQDVDGVKFDLYSAGAVLYSMIENSFPAHGSLSRITKPCPEALQWIIRRSMADLNARYGSAREMWGDLQSLVAAKDPWGVRPADLPSVSGERSPRLDFEDEAAPLRPAFAGAESSVQFALGGTDEPLGVPETAGTERRKTRRRVAGAVGIVGMAGLVLGGVAVLAAEHNGRSSSNGTLYFAQRSGGQSNSGQVRRPGTNPDRPRAVLAPSGRSEADRREAEDTWSLLLDPVLPPPDEDECDTAQVEMTQDASPRGTVLVLADTGLSTASSAIESLRDLLRKRGYGVLGLGDGDGDALHDIEITAGARNAIGVSGPNDSEALDRLQDYLDRNTELDSIVWLAPGTNERSVRVHAIRRSEVEEAEPAELRFAESVH